MARDQNAAWSAFLARALAMLPHTVGDTHRSSDSGLNTHDQRDFRQDRQWRLGNEELAGAEIRDSLDNLRP